jgi:hypothetical protein
MYVLECKTINFCTTASHFFLSQQNGELGKIASAAASLAHVSRYFFLRFYHELVARARFFCRNKSKIQIEAEKMENLFPFLLVFAYLTNHEKRRRQYDKQLQR